MICDISVTLYDSFTNGSPACDFWDEHELLLQTICYGNVNFREK